MTDGELRDLLVERLGRLERAQGETKARLGEVVQALKEHANTQLALRVGQDQLIEKIGLLTDRVDNVGDRVDRVTDRLDRLAERIVRGFTGRDEELRDLRERLEN